MYRAIWNLHVLSGIVCVQLCSGSFLRKHMDHDLQIYPQDIKYLIKHNFISSAIWCLCHRMLHGKQQCSHGEKEDSSIFITNFMSGRLNKEDAMIVTYLE